MLQRYLRVFLSMALLLVVTLCNNCIIIRVKSRNNFLNHGITVFVVLTASLENFTTMTFCEYDKVSSPPLTTIAKINIKTIA